MKKFEELMINPLLIKGIEKMKFEAMTEIQEKVIPTALEMQDIIAQAPTGTGKTVAYALPILNKIDITTEVIQTIVIAPTRELAVQITKEINTVAYYLKDVKAVAIYGGESIDRQITALKKRPQIIVATPGRLMDHMERRTVRLDNVTTVILDEADEMLNMGFKEDIDYILTNIKLDHQTMLFSATISKEIERIATRFLNKPITIRIAASELTVPTISQKMIEVKEKDKVEIIARLIDINDYKLVMVFCNTKRMVDEVTSQLLLRGFMTEALHGDMKQMQRDRVMNRFRGGLINILVASDVAARGLDIDDVDVVVNYDVPTDEEYYVHRIGRTGRAKKLGLSVTLVTRSEKNRLKSIANYTKAVITPMNIPS
ncbi:MAG: DEAD/DEAH box helicase, partial [Bacilli bacterium]|nr:DEAD/DEAH box helicase [Bacilli bacterium]